jgi:DNA-directed RNA polymerase subunit beta'
MIHLVSGVQGVYARRCADPRQAHRVIVRQMLRKVTVVDHGDTGLLPGESWSTLLPEYSKAVAPALAEAQGDASASPGGLGYRPGIPRGSLVAS